MNPNIQPQPTAAPTQGMSPQLAQLMQRGGVQPPTQSVPQAPGQPTQPQQTPQNIPTPQPTGAMGPSSATAPTPQTPFDSGEAKMIIGALSSRLKALSQMGGGIPPKAGV